ncbi:AMP-binding protein [Pseudomonas nicosulfuronedens]
MSATANNSFRIQERMEATPTPLQLLARSAQEFPHGIALEFLARDLDGTSRTISYQELLASAQGFAQALRSAGIDRDESVAILLPFVPEAVPALIGASAVCVAFPVNLLLSADAIRAQLSIARCRVIVTIGRHPGLGVLERVLTATQGMPVPPLLVVVPVDGEEEGPLSWASFTDVPMPAGGFPEDPHRMGALVHTGGTTGNPKLARLSLKNMASAALVAAAGMGILPNERLLTGLPLFHVGGAIDALLATLAVGGTLVFPALHGMRDPAVVSGIWDIVERHRITLIGAVPTSLAAIVNSPVGTAQLTHLRAIMTGGAALPRDVFSRLQALVDKPICQLYGMTESSGIATGQYTNGRKVEHTAGRPVPLVEISIGEPGMGVRPGAKGEILVRGPNLFHGYLTADGVIGDPQGDWFYSGDLGEVTESGELKIVGRSKDVIIRSGHNIDPMMIEEAAHRHPSIAQAAAVAMPDAYAGEVPVLFVVAKPGARVSTGEISSFIDGCIAEPPARPKQVFLLEELPMTPFAKVARFRLRQMAVEHCVKVALPAFMNAASVVCLDAAAKTVNIETLSPLSEHQLSEVTRAVQQLDIRLEVGVRH